MGRKKKAVAEKAYEYVPPKKKDVKNRKLLIEKGNWTVFKDGVGFTKCTFRATFVDDPQGCRGFGVTKQEATAILYAYECL